MFGFLLLVLMPRFSGVYTRMRTGWSSDLGTIVKSEYVRKHEVDRFISSNRHLSQWVHIHK
jgi:hypothetical protein